MLAQQSEEPVLEVSHLNGNQALSHHESASLDQEAPAGELHTEVPEGENSLSHLLSTLLAFEQQLPQYQETARARLLTKALCQELEMLQRQQAKHGKA